jgi:hypothetical protein
VEEEEAKIPEDVSVRLPKEEKIKTASQIVSVNEDLIRK